MNIELSPADNIEANIFEELSTFAHERGDDLYLIDQNSRSYSWSETQQLVEATARGLRELLPNTGSSVSIFSSNCADWVIADLGIIRSGNKSTPLFTSMTREKLAYALTFTEIELVFLGAGSDPEKLLGAASPEPILVGLPGFGEHPRVMSFEQFLKRGESTALPDYPSSDEVCALTFTSGTTGNPKAVMHSLRSLLHASLAFKSMTRQSELPRARFICYLPLGHIGEKVVTTVQSLLLGASITFCTSPDNYLEDLRSTRPTLIMGVPRIWEKLLQQVIASFGGSDAVLDARLEAEGAALAFEIREFLGLSEAVFCLSASAITPASTKHWFQKFGIAIADLYGQTEILPLTTQPPDNPVIGSVGIAAPGYDVRIATNGEILGRGPGMALGYFKDEEKTADAFQDGWVHTGDKGYLDEEGNLFIVGRLLDTFKTAKGKFVAPGPIEDKFLRLAFIEQASLHGLGLTQPVMLCTLGLSAAGKAESEIFQELLQGLREVNTTLEPHERMGAVLVSERPWTAEDGVLTHTHKTVRSKIAERYSPVIEAVDRRMRAGEREIVQWS